MVSVLMCTYNREKYLNRVIDSVLGQTYQELELIIVDDGSTDGTEELISNYQDQRIRYLKLDRNSFYCYAANYGLSHCKGEYVAFINSDDLWMPDKLEKQIRFLKENTQYGACFTRIDLIDDEENEISDECPDMKNVFERKFTSQKECLSMLLKQGNFLCHPSAVVRREILDQVGQFNLMYCQLADYDLWIRIVSETPVYILEDHLVKFRWDMKKKDQISMATRENTIRTFNEQILIRKHAVDELPDEKFSAFFREEFKNQDSVTHLEIEFEKAFWLAGCMKEAPELKVLGIEKLEQVMREEKAMETLREHFHMDIFDLYQWNKEDMYTSPWLMNDFNALKLQVQHQEQLLIEEQQKTAEMCRKMEEQQIQLSEKDRILQEKEQQIQNIHSQLIDTKRLAKDQNEQLVVCHEQMKQQRELIDTYANSTSWKVTEPMRRIMRWIKK